GDRRRWETGVSGSLALGRTRSSKKRPLPRACVRRRRRGSCPAGAPRGRTRRSAGCVGESGDGTDPGSTRAACATSSFATAKTAEWRLTLSAPARLAGRACVVRALLTAAVPRHSIAETKTRKTAGAGGV
ncbi:unnamed protein product, partial [Laminaria digitata]